MHRNVINVNIVLPDSIQPASQVLGRFSSRCGYDEPCVAGSGKQAAIFNACPLDGSDPDSLRKTGMAGYSNAGRVRDHKNKAIQWCGSQTYPG